MTSFSFSLSLSDGMKAKHPADVTQYSGESGSVGDAYPNPVTMTLLALSMITAIGRERKRVREREGEKVMREKVAMKESLAER